MMPTPSRVDRVLTWLRRDFAEWAVGSWALILGWFIFLTIFFNFLEMDGYFSRGLGEGSGVNPDLFMHIGWMFRVFAAVFLTLATKFATKGMDGQANKMKVIGAFCTIIVIAHAMGFGLKALHGKYANANAVSVVAETVTQSNADVIATLAGQKQSILDVLATQTATLDAEITRLDTDGKLNEELANTQKARRAELQDKAQEKIDVIDAEIVRITTAGGEHLAQTAKDVATAEPWPPLFVGLAQLTNMTEKPTDGQIFFAGVVFLMCWILLGDAICIFLPPALYALHLKDAKPRKVSLSPEAFADLHAKAEELDRRMANLDEGVDKALKTKGRKRRRAAAILQIEDQRAAAVKREEVSDEAQEAAGEDFESDPADVADDDNRDPESPEAPEGDPAPEPELTEANEPVTDGDEDGGENRDASQPRAA